MDTEELRDWEGDCADGCKPILLSDPMSILRAYRIATPRSATNIPAVSNRATQEYSPNNHAKHGAPKRRNTSPDPCRRSVTRIHGQRQLSHDRAPDTAIVVVESSRRREELRKCRQGRQNACLYCVHEAARSEKIGHRRELGE